MLCCFGLAGDTVAAAAAAANVGESAGLCESMWSGVLEGVRVQAFVCERARAFAVSGWGRSYKSRWGAFVYKNAFVA